MNQSLNSHYAYSSVGGKNQQEADKSNSLKGKLVQLEVLFIDFHALSCRNSWELYTKK